MTDPTTPPAGSAAEAAPRGVRTVAALLCGAQALALATFAVFYLYELAAGEGSDAGRVVMSALVIALFAAGLAVLARGWLRWTRWPRTPTIVWDTLLVPVGVGILQAGRAGLGWLVLLVALATAAAAVVAPRPPDPDALPDDL